MISFARTDRKQLVILLLGGLFLLIAQLLPRPSRTFDNRNFRRLWAVHMNRIGMARAYRLFINTYKRQDLRLQHFASHGMGQLIYDLYGSPGFAVCDETYAYGCSHGFFERAFAEHGVGIVSELSKVCHGSTVASSTSCEHGIGHGILEHIGHARLMEAIRLCEPIQQPFSYSGCVSGVFMEYNMPTVITGSTIYAIARPYNEAEPLAPCPDVPESAMKSCYFHLASWLNKLFGDYRAMGAVCEKIGQEEYRTDCYLGLGNIAPPVHRYKAKETIATCNSITTARGQSLCLVGASWGFFSFDHDRKKAYGMCKTVPEDLHPLCIQESE